MIFHILTLLEAWDFSLGFIQSHPAIKWWIQKANHADFTILLTDTAYKLIYDILVPGRVLNLSHNNMLYAVG